MPSICLRHRGYLVLLIALASCTQVDLRPAYEEAQQEIRMVTGTKTVHDPDAPVLTSSEINAFLADGLDLNEALQLALLNNRRLHAEFLTLGVARADFVQAGLLANPSLSLAFLFPSAGGRGRWTADVVGSLADLWQIPSRQAIAQAGAEQRLIELSRFAGELVAATKTAYFQCVAARAQQRLSRSNLEYADQALVGLRRQVAEGVSPKTDELLGENAVLSFKLAQQRAEREVVVSARELAALLSLHEDLLPVPLTDALAHGALPEEDREAFVAKSLMARPDLRAAARAVAAAEERVLLEHQRTFPELSTGLSAERPEAGSSSSLFFGPALTLELPIFDQNQAQLARARFEHARFVKEHEALIAEATQDLRSAFDKAAVASRTANLVKKQVLPQAERNVALAEKLYAFGESTVLPLLQSRQQCIEARQTLIAAALEATLAQIALERAAGAPLSTMAR
jgi:cobalt-zinc-cadmium efflux system outer membrane protein